jgi:hypothetical protein
MEQATSSPQDMSGADAPQSADAEATKYADGGRQAKETNPEPVTEISGSHHEIPGNHA